MLENEIEVINISDLPQNKKIEKEIFSKPMQAIIICVIMAIVLIITQKMAILGIIILVFALFIWWKVPNSKVMDLYDDSLVVYSKVDKTLCQRVAYEDIIEWTMRQGKQTGDMLIVRVEGDKYLYVESFQSIKIVRTLNKFIPNKEVNRKKNAEMTNSKFKWNWKK